MEKFDKTNSEHIRIVAAYVYAGENVSNIHRKLSEDFSLQTTYYTIRDICIRMGLETLAKQARERRFKEPLTSDFQQAIDRYLGA